MNILGLILVLLGIVIGLLILFLLILAGRGLQARKMPPLQKWHDAKAGLESSKLSDFASFADYLAAEAHLLEIISRAVIPENDVPFNRYTPHVIGSAYVDGHSLNGSFQLFPEGEERRGGVLLVHGLTDSPYHMRAVADCFARNGYYVLGLRLPGHGSIPGALLKIKWEDWYEAVVSAAQWVRQEIDPIEAHQFFMGGFSTGGALTLRYALEAAAGETAPRPDKLFLFSPAIGVDKEAELADWHSLISWLPFFRQFQWLNIKPEYDLFKYNSFAKNAADQVYELTKANEKLIARLAVEGEGRSGMPPIYAFQSMVDATVITDKLIDLFARIGPEESELVLFDHNRLYEQFFKTEVRNRQPAGARDRPGFKSRLIVVSNKTADDSDGYDSEVKFTLYQPHPNGHFEAVELQMEEEVAWPEYIFALSHGSIPIAPEDEYYGQDSTLGNINIKGEHDVLAIDEATLMKLRYNPFFFFIRERIERAIV